jgi:hypothetical protein
MPLTTVFTALNPMDAQVVRSRLEAAGLHPEVENELPALTMAGHALAAGGIVVKVPDEEVTIAREIIDDKGSPTE